MGPAALRLRRCLTLGALALLGCASRYAGCASYTAGRLRGADFEATVRCAPHTELALNVTLSDGCSARWTFEVQRGSQSRGSALSGDAFRARDCAVTRSRCASARAALEQRPTAGGTWVAAMAPEGRPALAFVSSECDSLALWTTSLPGGQEAGTLAATLASAPEGSALLAQTVARDDALSSLWGLLCPANVERYREGLRRGTLECRVPQTLRRTLLAQDRELVRQVWSALLERDLPCATGLEADLLDSARELAAELAQHSLEACERSSCVSEQGERALRLAGALRATGAREVLLRVARSARPGPADREATEAARSQAALTRRVALAARRSLLQLDPPAGTSLVEQELRAQPPSPSPVGRPWFTEECVPLIDENLACELYQLLARDAGPQGLDVLARLAADAALPRGTRQRALLSLASSGDPRGLGTGLPDAPLDGPLLAAARAALDARRSASQPSAHSAGGHHRPHHHHHLH